MHIFVHYFFIIDRQKAHDINENGKVCYTMSISDFKKREFLKKEIEMSFGKNNFPSYAYEKIIKALKKAKVESKANITINRIYTYGEYLNKLTLLDKCYSTRIHEYGIKEELIFSLNKIFPGYCKQHRYLSNRGIMVNEKDLIEPKIISNKIENIFIIKETSWDYNIDDNKIINYMIHVYVPNTEYENTRILNAKQTIRRLKDELKKGGLS